MQVVPEKQNIQTHLVTSENQHVFKKQGLEEKTWIFRYEKRNRNMFGALK